MEKKTLQIQETTSNFEWFSYIINNLIDEIFNNNPKQERITIEKEILSIINHWYQIIEQNNISKEIFSEEKLSYYIMQDKNLYSKYYLIVTEGISKGLLTYLQDFNVSKLDKQPKRFNLMWNSINKIQQSINRNIKKEPLSVSEYIDDIDEQLLNELIPEKLESKFKMWGIEQKYINNINLWREKTTIDNVRWYIDKILLSPKSKEDYKKNTFNIIKNNNIQSGVLFVYITKDNAIWYVVKNPDDEYFQQNIIQLQEKHKKVFILKKPKC